MDALLHIIDLYGLWVVFFCVLLDQGGLPVPAYPPLIVMTARATESHDAVWPIMAVAVFAALLSDLAWFIGGRRYGAALLRLMCKVSLSPDSCVGLTRRVYVRWGAPSLVFAKYIPGFAAVATTLAGESGTSFRRFVLYDGIGAALWAAGAVAIGVMFHDAVEAVLLELEYLGHYAILILLGALVLFIASKWWQRRRFQNEIRMVRVSPRELSTMLAGGATATVVDVRPAARRAKTGWIPGSIQADSIDSIAVDPGADIVIYCDCPNDASAAVFASKLKQAGYSRVRPLAGGIGAWLADNLPLEYTAGPPSAELSVPAKPQTPVPPAGEVPAQRPVA